jgi:serine/threonine-protein kinase
MKAEHDRFLGLAGSISDGEQLDWAGLKETASSKDDRALVRSLEVVAQVSRLQRVGQRLPAGRYGQLDVLEKIGEGTYGAVHRAWDAQLEREVAIKVLHPREDADSLLAEGRRLASAKHPNVVTIHAAERIDGRPAIRMEFVRGRTLAEIVRERGPLGSDEIASIGADLCRALAAVHGAGIVHRDVKAQNAMREQGGRIVLMDFGPGGATPLYMAPELLRGAAPTARSDIYSLGVLLHHLATGSFPVVGTTIEELRAAHDGGRARALGDERPDLPGALARVIERAVAPDPNARFESAGEMARALDAMRGAGAARAVRPRRPRATAAIALVALLATAAILWILPASRRGPSQVSGILSSTVARHEGPVGDASGGSAGGPRDESAASAYTIEAGFHRGARGREPLADGARLAVGDSISLSIQASESLHVYVIDEDDRGEAYLLFPVADMTPSNPLASNTAHVLPGSRGERRFYWRVTSAGGREHLVLLASRQRLVGFESEMLAVERPVEGREPVYPRLTSRAKERLRGMGGLVSETSATPRPAATGSLLDLARPLARGPERVSGVWIRRIDLVNPAR